jgi:hypothetical protein
MRRIIARTVRLTLAHVETSLERLKQWSIQVFTAVYYDRSIRFYVKAIKHPVQAYMPFDKKE